MTDKTIAIDFDGVIHRYAKGWHDGTTYDEPMAGAFDALIKLSKNYKIVIFSARPVEQIRRWMNEWWRKEKHGVSTPPYEITNIKPTAFAYIDDRAIRFTNWRDIINYF